MCVCECVICVLFRHLKVRVEQLQKGELSEKEMQSLLEELTRWAACRTDGPTAACYNLLLKEEVSALCSPHCPLSHSPHSQSGDAISSAVHSPLGMGPEEPGVEGMDVVEPPSQSGDPTTTTGELQNA